MIRAASIPAAARVAVLVLAVLATLLAALPAGAAAQEGEAPRAPELSSRAAYLVEPSTGDVIVAKRAEERRAIASTTKLMTALVTRAEVSLDDVFTAAGYDPAPVESQLGLREGERMEVRDLLTALLLESANDAAVTLAEGVSGSRPAFVDQMNRRADALGLAGTRFSNAVGLDDPDNFSTAKDLVTLALAVRRDEFLRRTVDRTSAVLESGATTRTVENRNTLVRRHDFVDGMKTGRTQEAGYVLVGSATRGGVTVVGTVLGAPTEAARDRDMLALLRHGLEQYERTTAVRRGELHGNVPLAYRDEAVPVEAGATVRRTVRGGEELQTTVTGLPDEVDGPLDRGERVGTLVVRQRDEVVARVPLLTTRAVEKAGVALRMADLLQRPSTLALLAALAACSLPLVVLRRRALRRGRADERTPA